MQTTNTTASNIIINAITALANTLNATDINFAFALDTLIESPDLVEIEVYFATTEIKTSVVKTLLSLATEVQVNETTKMGRIKPTTSVKLVIKF